MDTTAYIRQQLDTRLKTQRVSVVKDVIPEKEKSKFLQTFLGFCIVFMAVAITIALISKGVGFDFRQFIKQDKVVETTTEVIVDRPTIDPNIISDTEWKERLETRLDNIESNYRIWKHRVWLLGLAHNENANIEKRIHGDQGYIVFDDLWKINKMPETMALSPEQRQSLQRDDIK